MSAVVSKKKRERQPASQAATRHSGEGGNLPTSSFRTPRSGDPESSASASARHSGAGRNPVSAAPSQLEDGWIRVPLAEVGEWRGGGTPSKANPSFWAGGHIPWVSPKDMKSDVITDTQDHITEEAVMNSATNLVDAGSVLLVARSGILQHTLPIAITSRQVALNQDIKAIKPRKGLRADYLALAFKAYEREILHRCTKTGTTVQSLELPVLLRFEIPIAPPEQQPGIVAEIEKQLTRLDAGVAALRRVQANLKRYRAAVLKAACEGRLVPSEAELARTEGRTYETGEQLLARILADRRKNWHGRGKYKEPAASDATNLPALPAGWKWAILEQLAEVVRGASPRPAGDPQYFGGSVPWITVGPLTADQSPYLRSVPATLNEAGRERSRFIEPHTLLLTNSGATLGVPKISLIAGCINDGVAALQSVEYPLKLYLLYFLHTQTERLRSVNQGAAQPNLNTTIIKAINVPLPPLAEQVRIVAEVERRLSMIEELEAAIAANVQRATRLRQSILQHAFAKKSVEGVSLR